MSSPVDRRTLLVVGLGMVGIAFIERLLSLDQTKQYKIIACGEEAYLPYNRVGLSEYLQHRSVEKLFLEPPKWYTDVERSDRFEYHIGEQVTSIDSIGHRATTSSGREMVFDICVLATGSRARLPPYITPGQAATTSGVFVYRNIADLNGILDFVQKSKDQPLRAIVVGAGLLGLEAAKAVHDLGTVPDITIVSRAAFPLSHQVDSDGGELVLRRLRDLGVKVLTSCIVDRLITSVSTEDSQLENFSGLELHDGSTLSADLIIFAVGIEPRHELAQTSSGLDVHATKGGFVVDDALATSAKDVFAIGECANWNGQTYGLIGPGIEMANILAFNLTQTSTPLGTFAPRKMNNPDLSTKLKLLGVDVASFGDPFADQKNDGELSVRRVEALVYKDPIAAVYKKFVFTADGKHLLGGMMIGDVGDYVKLVSIVSKKKSLDQPPSQFILGASNNAGDASIDLDDDTVVCSCNHVSKADITTAVTAGCKSVPDLKARTKAGTGCGGCVPLVTRLLESEMKRAGVEAKRDLCPHFSQSRADLFTIIKIKGLRDLPSVMLAVGKNPDAIGCEICKPAIGSILSSLYNEPILKLVHHQNQDTNDKYLANIQRNGSFSVIPRIAAGEITPDGLIAIGQIAKKYGLYTKITGGQRIDMFGAQKPDLPAIWTELVNAGFESGHAYGKSLRTVKSCVGTSWCRYGVGDSVGLAIQLEERYKSVRSPHKIKGGVSGCVRECAEAQSKDFGLIATDKGWNLFIAGNGGVTPRHAQLFASDVPPSHVVRLIDRYLMFYIRTADKLTRTARWVEGFEGGIERLKKILIEDELGICEDLEREMAALVGTFECEWTAVVRDPERQKMFRQFVNTDERKLGGELIEERGQQRPADWPKEFPKVIISDKDVGVSRDQWEWRPVAKVSDLAPGEEYTSSAAVRFGDTQLAVFHVPRRGYYAVQQMCPHKRAFVLDHGVVGDDSSGTVYVSCPLHKRNYDLANGKCLSDASFGILAFEAKAEDGFILVKLPEPDTLDATLGSSKWMVKAATAEVYGRGGGAQIEIVGPGEQAGGNTGEPAPGCGNPDLDW